MLVWRRVHSGQVVVLQRDRPGLLVFSRRCRFWWCARVVPAAGSSSMMHFWLGVVLKVSPRGFPRVSFAHDLLCRPGVWPEEGLCAADRLDFFEHCLKVRLAVRSDAHGVCHARMQVGGSWAVRLCLRTDPLLCLDTVLPLCEVATLSLL